MEFFLWLGAQQDDFIQFQRLLQSIAGRWLGVL
jgi:hypothetical protein